MQSIIVHQPGTVYDIALDPPNLASDSMMEDPMSHGS